MADRNEQGAAVAEFVLVMTLLIPLVLGIAQVALVMHVRNTATAAASDGARAAAVYGANLDDGSARTQELIRASIADRFAEGVSAEWAQVGGAPGVEVTVTADVPPLGLFGPAMRVQVTGHAVREVAP